MKYINGNEVEDPIVETAVPPTSAPETPQPQVTDDGGIEVVVDDGQTPPAPTDTTPPPQPAAPAQPQVDLQSMRNKMFAQDRIITSLRRTLDEQTGLIRETAKTIAEIRKEREAAVLLGRAPANGQEDDVDKLVKEGRWKDGVKLIVAQSITQATQAQSDEMAKAKQEEEVRVAQQANISRVLQRHPELDDNSSEKWQVFDSILAENPRWRNSPDGPLLAMYQMEERMNLARTPVTPARPGAPVPVRPGVPVGSPSLPPTRPVAPSNKVVLTAEQKSFCDDNQIPYEDYAKSLGFVARGEGKVGIQP